MTDPAVTLRKVGRVALITINRPKIMNAMTAEISDGFAKIVDQLVEDPSEYGCAVVTGSGRAFSAGGDLDWLRLRTLDTPSRNSKIMHDFYNKFLRVRDIPIPVVCAINGAAIGAGFCFAMACDIRIASEKAKLGFTFVGLGLHPGMGATHLIASIAGMEVAMRMLLTGDIILGKEAKELRLVSQITADGASCQKAAMALAERIASQAPVAVRATVRSLRIKQNEGLDSALWREADAQSHGYNTDDCKEGIEAVATKRKPNFKMYESYADLPPLSKL